jgi:transaldolase
MKIYIDTANIEEIREAESWGILDGVTTNPSLVAREKRPYEEVVREICGIVDGPVSAESVGMDADAIVEEGRALAAIHDQVVVKVPMMKEGLKAISRLSAEGIRVNCTLVFSPLQALVAAKAGAAFISPFVGRLDDISHFGMEGIEQIMQILENYDYPSEVIVASVRTPVHVLQAALTGAHIATIPFGVLDKLYRHPLTDTGIEKFLADHGKIPGSS